MAQTKSISARLVEISAEEGCWLYNETELGRNFVKAVTLGKDESREHWIECTDAEKQAYEEEQARLLGKDTDNAEGSMNAPIPYTRGEVCEQGKWYLDDTFGLIECVESGVATTDEEMADIFDLPPV